MNYLQVKIWKKKKKKKKKKSILFGWLLAEK